MVDEMHRNAPKDEKYDAQSSFRVESELKKAVVDFASNFDHDESWGWRVLAVKALGDTAPDVMKQKFAKMLGRL